MKKASFLIVLFAGFILWAGNSAHALQCKEQALIPDRYLLLVCPDLPADTNFDEKKVRESALQALKDNKVKQINIVFYEPGKKFGDIPLAVGAYGDVHGDDGVFFNIREMKASDKASDEEKENTISAVTKMIGYQIEPKELWEAYDDNEVVADDDFKGKQLLVMIKNSGLAKDAAGRPYLRVRVDKYGVNGLQIFLDKSDPFLRRLKKGQNIAVQIVPKGFFMKDVVADGKVIFIEESKKAKGAK